MTEANTQLSPTQRTVLLKLHSAGEHSIAELAELFLHQSPHRLPRDRTNARQEVRCRRSLSDPSGGGPQGLLRRQAGGGYAQFRQRSRAA